MVEKVKVIIHKIELVLSDPVKFNGVQLYTNPLFKLLKTSNELGLQGKKLKTITEYEDHNNDCFVFTLEAEEQGK